MFIVSKRNFLIQIPGREAYKIPKDYIGAIPDYIANHWMVQAAIQSGLISTPEGKDDKQLEEADVVAEEKAEAADIRPDAPAAEKKGRKSAEK